MKTRIYKDKAGEWRWTVTSPNGRKLAESGEGYANKADCVEALERVTREGSLQMIKNDLALLVAAINRLQAGGKA